MNPPSNIQEDAIDSQSPHSISTPSNRSRSHVDPTTKGPVDNSSSPLHPPTLRSQRSPSLVSVNISTPSPPARTTEQSNTDSSAIIACITSTSSNSTASSNLSINLDPAGLIQHVVPPQAVMSSTPPQDDVGSDSNLPDFDILSEASDATSLAASITAAQGAITASSSGNSHVRATPVEDNNINSYKRVQFSVAPRGVPLLAAGVGDSHMLQPPTPTVQTVPELASTCSLHQESISQDMTSEVSLESNNPNFKWKFKESYRETQAHHQANQRTSSVLRSPSKNAAAQARRLALQQQRIQSGVLSASQEESLSLMSILGETSQTTLTPPPAAGDQTQLNLNE